MGRWWPYCGLVSQYELERPSRYRHSVVFNMIAYQRTHDEKVLGCTYWLQESACLFEICGSWNWYGALALSHVHWKTR